MADMFHLSEHVASRKEKDCFMSVVCHNHSNGFLINPHCILLVPYNDTAAFKRDFNIVSLA